MALLAGILPLRFCTAGFATGAPSQKLPSLGHVVDFVTPDSSWKVAHVTTHPRYDDMTTMTTPATQGWRSDASIILPGWSVTGQYPRHASTVKDGRPWVAEPSIIGTRSTPNLLNMVAEPRLNVTE